MLRRQGLRSLIQGRSLGTQNFEARGFPLGARTCGADRLTAHAGLSLPWGPALAQTTYSRFFATATGEQRLRNVAIIAHVDHGKTSLVDKLLTQSGTLDEALANRAMDSNALEKERGITILAKHTSLDYNGYHINIVDTPGHGDFGGEVERIMSMVDGVVLLVDATEGPMTQTKFVLTKALSRGLKPIVVLNKMDRDSIRVDDVETEIFDLFAALGASDEQLSYPTLYASARQGWAVKDRSDPRQDLSPLFDAIVEHVPAPVVDQDQPFCMLVTTLESDPHLGRILVGRIRSGSVKPGDELHTLSREGKVLGKAKVTKVIGRKGITKYQMESAAAGNIIGVAGFPSSSVTDTLCHPSIAKPVPADAIDPPVISVVFSINTSPLAGKEGTKMTSTLLRDRLNKELESNVTIEVEPTGKEALEVRGRGELQLSILIENMRREGFELSISPPEVLMREENGRLMEPIEEVHIEIAKEYVGMIIERMTARRAEVVDIKTGDDDIAHIQLFCPSRSLIGFRSEVNALCRGTLVIHHLFHGYQPYKGDIEKSRKGALVSTADGLSTTYAIQALEPRGTLFITPGTRVYTGMIVGENAKKGDMDVNPVKEKQLTNVRSTQKEEFFRLTPPRIFGLEEAITYINGDELVEVTPTQIRMRKAILDPGVRESQARKKKKD